MGAGRADFTHAHTRNLQNQTPARISMEVAPNGVPGRPQPPPFVLGTMEASDSYSVTS